MTYLLLFLIVFLAGMLGVSIGYHRYLTHKSFTCVRWFEVLIVFLGIPAGTPVQWAGNHRVHHRFADTKDDPHSPLYGGFWWSHVGWYINSKNPFICFLYSIAGPLRSLFDAYHRPRTNQEYISYAKDVSDDPVFAWMSRPFNYFVLVWIHTIVPFAFVYYLASWKGVAALYLIYVYIYNLGDSVNSLGHMWGTKNKNSKHEARNNVLLGYLAFGDGWHSNHHDDPAKAQHGKNLQFDISYLFLRLMKVLGVVKSLKE